MGDIMENVDYGIDTKEDVAPPGFTVTDNIDDFVTSPTNNMDVPDLYTSDDESVDPVYRAKSHLLTEAIQDIGMGRYQVS